MVYQTGVIFGSIMLATGLISVWTSYPTTEDGSFDSDPGVRTLMTFASGILVSLIGVGIVVLSLLD